MTWTEEYFDRLRVNIDAYQIARECGSTVRLVDMTDAAFDAYLSGPRDQQEDLTGLSVARVGRLMRS